MKMYKVIVPNLHGGAFRRGTYEKALATATLYANMRKVETTIIKPDGPTERFKPETSEKSSGWVF